MDQRTTYSRIIKMLKEAKQKEISLDELKQLIMKHLGSSQRTMDNALRTMGGTGLIKDVGNCRFEINAKANPA